MLYFKKHNIRHEPIMGADYFRCLPGNIRWKKLMIMAWKKVLFNADGSLTLKFPSSSIQRDIGIKPLVWGKKIEIDRCYEYKLFYRRNRIIVKFRCINAKI